MTAALPSPAPAPPASRTEPNRIRRFFTQFILVVLINVPSVSFGLAMGWVSLESGGDETTERGMALVGAAATTFLAGALAMPVAARAIAAGRKPAMLATSVAFILCWSLKLCGGWGVILGRAAAGLGGVAAWVIPPMLAVEMCSAGVRGAAAVALVLAHNVGFLLMYLAADYDVPGRTVLVWCLLLSVVHCVAYLFVPESPAYLAANGKDKEARAALAWCGGYAAGVSCAALDAELKALPAPDLEPVSPFRLAKEMLSDVRRRKAFMISLAAVAGQEMCGVLTLLQFAERVFHLAGEGGRRASTDAVVLGTVQLVASALSLYLVEKIGRRPLFVWGAIGTGVCLGLGAGAVWAGAGWAALLTLAAAVACDSAGLQPAPYALLAELFTYQYRGCAVLLVTAAGDLGNAVEIVLFPTLVAAAGLAPGLALAAAMTLLLAAFAYLTVPETMDKTVEEIYRELCPGLADPTPALAAGSDLEKHHEKHRAIRKEDVRVEETYEVLPEKYLNNLDFRRLSCDNYRFDEKTISDKRTDNGNDNIVIAKVQNYGRNNIQNGYPPPHVKINVTDGVQTIFSNDAFKDDEVIAPRDGDIKDDDKNVTIEANYLVKENNMSKRTIRSNDKHSLDLDASTVQEDRWYNNGESVSATTRQMEQYNDDTERTML